MRISDWSSDVCSSDLILKAWKTTEPFSWEGEQYKFSTVAIWPKITQRPHPPVFGSGNSDSSVVFAAQRRIGIAFSFAPPEVVKKWIELYRAERSEEHTSELQSLMRISYAVSCLNKKQKQQTSLTQYIS